MIEVFKTNVQEIIEAQQLVDVLQRQYINTRINFDLTDCDKILRVEGDGICTNTITEIVRSHGYCCEILE